MTTTEFNEILDFAIEREKEAVAFYRELQQQSKFADQKQMLKEMEQMELGHIAVIESIRKKGVKEQDIQSVSNLKISEYLSKELSEEELTYQSILIKAMKREENSFKLYTQMSQKFPDSEISTLFKRLASDEAKHKLHFEQLYDDFISQGN
ncbi:MAG: ferritin family protein [Candidatus Cloacimonadaceae bacterium]|jgi:rubrerythrin|nr:ferritin family protein [Candidatus Cloacimonadota bacterium]MDY0128082.1 ferritin family protein [Candidatus Cloacimonadaceae bacterium]MCB5254142.1 ferritin family protein [Candidatus Cloacimonadota bacterium]MCK9178396.1 ferritin family protein [Candidatus Cloacimonadota bacterium]MCK9242645.1 ferritin family protein [Candidatus Cloacimonadota bacterium]